MKRFWRTRGLSCAVFALFFLFWAGQLLTGWPVANEELRQTAGQELSFAEYLRSAHALQATAENWESEFLQMCAFVVLTACLFQRGSAQSHDPAATKQTPRPISADAPYPVRRGGWLLRIYEHSLSLSLGLLFLISFGLHVLGGTALYNEARVRQGEMAVGACQFLGTAQFWFESFQNWQSEFLSIGAMVVLTIFLREKGSAESKRVETPHRAHDD